MSDEFKDSEEVPEDPFTGFDPQPEKEEPEMPGKMTDAGASDAGISDDDKLWAFLAYVLTPLLPIIIMLIEEKKQRPFIRAHNGQALVWGLLNVLVAMFTSFLCGIPALLLWLVGCYWGWQAYQGQQVTIPIISEFVKGQGWA